MEFPMKNATLQNMRAEYNANMEKIKMEGLVDLVKTKIIYVAYMNNKSYMLPGIGLEGKKRMPYKIEDYEERDLSRNETVEANFQNTLSAYYTRYTFEKCSKVITEGIGKLFPEMKISIDWKNQYIQFKWS